MTDRETNGNTRPTPGPSSVEDVPKPGDTIADVRWSDVRWLDEDGARLLAAGPDLLAACEAAADALARMRRAAENLEALLAAAIAKAKGGTP